MLYQLRCFPGPSGHYLLNNQPRCVRSYTDTGDTVLNEWGGIRAVCHPRAAGSVYLTPVQYSRSSAGSVSEGRVLVRRSPGRTKVAVSQAGAPTRYHSSSAIYSPFWSFLLLAQAQTQSPTFPPKDIIPGGTQLRPAEGLADLRICTTLTDVLAHPGL